MEFIDALDYRLAPTPNYRGIDFLEINEEQIDTELLEGAQLHSYGKSILSFYLFPGVSGFIEKISARVEADIIVGYSHPDSTLTARVKCKYDHFVLEGSTIKLVFYHPNGSNFSISEVFIREENEPNAD